MADHKGKGFHGPKYDLSHCLYCFHLNDCDDQDLRSTNGPNVVEKLPITNYLPILPLHHNPFQGDMPALRKAIAQRLTVSVR